MALIIAPIGSGCASNPVRVLIRLAAPPPISYRKMCLNGSGVFINNGNMKFEYVPKNYPEWHSPENPEWIKLKIRLIEP